MVYVICYDCITRYTCIDEYPPKAIRTLLNNYFHNTLKYNHLQKIKAIPSQSQCDYTAIAVPLHHNRSAFTTQLQCDYNGLTQHLF